MARPLAQPSMAPRSVLFEEEDMESPKGWIRREHPAHDPVLRGYLKSQRCVSESHSADVSIGNHPKVISPGLMKGGSWVPPCLRLKVEGLCKQKPGGFPHLFSPTEMRRNVA